MKHTVSVLVENESGVLSRIASLFSRRGFNINSLSVGETESSDISRITLVVKGDEAVVEQLMKQLNKLIPVYKVSNITNDPAVSRGLAFIKVKTDYSNRSEIIQIVDVFRGEVVDVGKDSIMVEITGDEEKIKALEELLKPYGIEEMVRTGKIAMVRGEK
ncbi:acetolactate synthase small subunit [Halarsenatibacter silvermanii]|uniref:Acetolactate synthase small subunit n=1 Tax=Halarsenatibacter silvermanii TaxID=321763 RepID=A0A1G9QUX8_9FIRM|nr:acetolactate synthase small subunit [Halarsenatibacter silvermanii]SDM14065.1 acetolactate synthase, small subunit [Halarsenatibacter silvermanii]